LFVLLKKVKNFEKSKHIPHYLAKSLQKMLKLLFSIIYLCFFINGGGRITFLLFCETLCSSLLIIFQVFFIKFHFNPYYIPQQAAPKLKKDHDICSPRQFHELLAEHFPARKIKRYYDTSVLAAQLFRHQLMCPGLPPAIRNPAP
jgi:hypothetical protein